MAKVRDVACVATDNDAQEFTATTQGVPDRRGGMLVKRSVSDG